MQNADNGVDKEIISKALTEPTILQINSVSSFHTHIKSVNFGHCV